MHPTHLLFVGATLAGCFVPAQDLLGVAWSGAVVRVNSYTGAATPLGTGLAGQNALARDSSGTFWSTSGSPTSAAYSLTTVDPNTGAATIVYPGVDLRGLAAGPGPALYGINNQSADTLLRIDTTTGARSTIGSTGFGGVQALALHQGLLYAWDIGQGLLIVNPATGAAIDPFPTVTGPSGMQALCSHPDGRLLVGGGSANMLYVVDVTTGSTTLIGPLTGASDLRGLDPLGGYTTSLGQACNGAFGPATLTVNGVPQVGSSLLSVSVNHAPNAVSAVLFGLSTTWYAGLNLPLLLDPILGTSNCRLYASIDVSVIAFTDANSPAQLQLPIGLPAAAAGAIFHMQHACFEPVAGNLSWSNGITIQVQ